MLIRVFITVLLLASTTVSVFGQSDSAPQNKNRIVVMGMIHSHHRTSQEYDLATVKNLIKKIDPDYVFCEIPPDRIAEANRQFRETGTITESRVKVFPEYVDALYPLSKEMNFEIVPCAGWTKSMADARRKKLGELKSTHQQQFQEMNAAQQQAEQAIKAAGGADNPAFIHSDKYDQLVKVGMRPYDQHFNEILGPGGWENINKAHYGLVAKNLDKLKNQDKTVLIMFGAWHKYWFKEQLRKRDDIELVNINEYLK